MHFVGEVYSESELCPLIAAADLCVSPGAVGLTVMHALVYGTPVITHDDLDNQKPEFEAIQPGVTGALFRRGDVQSGRHHRAWLSVDRDRTREDECREWLLRFYTADNQREIIDQAVDGVRRVLQRGARRRQARRRSGGGRHSRHLSCGSRPAPDGTRTPLLRLRHLDRTAMSFCHRGSAAT